MKKTPLIHSEISYLISKMGHRDMLVIGDSGLPIPQNVQRIDLALRKGIPSFLDTLETILEEMRVEEVIIAKEMKEISPDLYEKLLLKIKELEDKDIKITQVSHEIFKDITKEAVGVVRTGEYTPYANIILKSGVVF